MADKQYKLKLIMSDDTTHEAEFTIPQISEADKQEIAEQAAGLIDTALLDLIGTGEVTV